MASVCGYADPNHVERLAAILPHGLKDSWRLSEQQWSAEAAGTRAPAGGLPLVDEVVTVPGVSYGDLAALEPSLKYTFSLHSPTLFRSIRLWYGIRDEDFKASLFGHRAIKGGVIGGGGADDGEKGVVFFFSANRKFILRSISAEEFDLGRRLLPDYLAYLEDGNPYTMLPRLFGLAALKLQGRPPLFLQVSNNVFYIDRPLARKYELKGASQDRYVSPPVATTASSNQTSPAAGAELGLGGQQSLGAPVVLKEHNFSARGLVREAGGEYPYPEWCNRLSVGPEMRENLLQQLERDCRWLEDHGLVDYSLAVGVVNDFEPRPSPQSGAADQYRASSASPSWASSRRPPSATVRVPGSSNKADDQRTAWCLAAVHDAADVSTMAYGTGEESQHSGVDPIALPGKGETYVLGLVDVLQEYDCKRALEHAAKQVIASCRGGHPHCMSVVPPNVFSARLRHYIGQNTE